MPEPANLGYPLGSATYAPTIPEQLTKFDASQQQYARLITYLRGAIVKNANPNTVQNLSGPIPDPQLLDTVLQMVAIFQDSVGQAVTFHSMFRSMPPRARLMLLDKALKSNNERVSALIQNLTAMASAPPKPASRVPGRP